MAKKQDKKMQPTVPLRRDEILSHLAVEYRDAVQYTGELRRAIDSFSGQIPDSSPNRYLRMDCGDAIMQFLSKVKRATIPELVQEMEAGGCIFGQVKSPREIITKIVKAYVQSGKLQWKDKKNTIVQWKEPKKES
jgi:hypothetical protein